MRKKTDEKQKQQTSLIDRLRQIDLPTALQRRVWKQYLAAVGLALAILVMGGYYHNPTYLIGFLILRCYHNDGIRRGKDLRGACGLHEQ